MVPGLDGISPLYGLPLIFTLRRTQLFSHSWPSKHGKLNKRSSLAHSIRTIDRLLKWVEENNLLLSFITKEPLIDHHFDDMLMMILFALRGQSNMIKEAPE